MALLAKLIDVQSMTRAGDDLKGVTLSTLFHSLVTTPQAIILQMRSIAAIGVQPNPALIWPGANGSVVSIGFAVPSTSSAPTFMFDAYVMRFHSLIA